MAVVLNFELIRYNEISDVVDNMVSSVDLNGPAECADSASTLWSILVLLRGREHVGTVSETSEHIIRWLCNRWSPCKCVLCDSARLRAHQRNSKMGKSRLCCTPFPTFQSSPNTSHLSTYFSLFRPSIPSYKPPAAVESGITFPGSPYMPEREEID